MIANLFHHHLLVQVQDLPSRLHFDQSFLILFFVIAELTRERQFPRESGQNTKKTELFILRLDVVVSRTRFEPFPPQQVHPAQQCMHE